MAQHPHRPNTQAAAPAKSNAGRKKADPNETPEARFKRLAEQRVSRALKSIAAVGALTGKGYAHSEEQRSKIAQALSGQVSAAISRLESGGKAQSLFSL